MASKDFSTYQWMTFWFMWLNRTKITSIILTHAHAKCDFKKNKTKF